MQKLFKSSNRPCRELQLAFMDFIIPRDCAEEFLPQHGTMLVAGMFKQQVRFRRKIRHKSQVHGDGSKRAVPSGSGPEASPSQNFLRVWRDKIAETVYKMIEKTSA